MKRPLVIFGAGNIAQVVNFYFERFSEYETVAYVVDDLYFQEKAVFDRPCYPLSKALENQNLVRENWFIALSYKRFNTIRQEKFNLLMSLGVKLTNFIHPSNEINIYLSNSFNNLILENNIIQPFCKFGNNVFMWTNNHIGHHSNIDSNVFISSGVVISGNTNIGENCFFGVNSSVIDNITIGSRSWIGPGQTILTNLKPNSKIL